MRLLQALKDFAYGIHAGNAIRHGLPAPQRHPRRRMQVELRRP